MKKIEFCKNLRAEISTGVAELILGPPEGMPITDAILHGQFTKVWSILNADPEVLCILIRSEGKGFCAGGSHGPVQEMLDHENARLRVMCETREIVQGMIDCDVPIVSAINGAAVGVGAVIALLADISVAGRRTKIIDGHTTSLALPRVTMLRLFGLYCVV